MINDTLDCIIVSGSCESDIELKSVCIKDSALQDMSENENRLSRVFVYDTSQFDLPLNLIIISVATGVHTRVREYGLRAGCIGFSLSDAVVETIVPLVPALTNIKSICNRSSRRTNASNKSFLHFKQIIN